MNVLHVVPSYYPATFWGGPIFSVYGLNNALAVLPNVSLKVLTTDSAGRGLENRLPADLHGLFTDYEVIFAKRVAGASVSLELLRKLPSLLRSADIVHLTATYSFPTLPTLLFSRLFRKPVVWSPRGAIQDAHEWEGTRHKRLKRFWELICNALVRPGKVVMHTTSERERIAIQKRLPRVRAVVIPNGVTPPMVQLSRDWLPQGRLRLIYLGRLSPKKGVENLLEAVELLKYENVALTIYGTGEKEYVAKLQALAGRLGFAEGQVAFAGHVEGAAKAEAFANADLCVVPSYTENFCMVVAEALAHGVPVIASRGTPWQAIEERECGLWVENAPHALAPAISKMRGMNLADMGARGREWMRHEYSWANLALDMLGVYRTLVSS